MIIGEKYTTWAINVEANLDAAELWEVVVPAEDAAAVALKKKDKPVREPTCSGRSLRTCSCRCR